MKTKATLTTVALLGVILAAGCSPQARQDVSQAGKEVGQATEKSVEATGQAVEKTGEAAGRTAAKAGEAVEGTAENAGEAVGGAVENAGEAVGGAVKGVAKGTQEAVGGAALTLKVKNALVADKQINASTINVDTEADNNTVVLKGAVPSAAAKKRATTVAQQTLKDSKSAFKVRNDLTVGQGTGSGGQGAGAR